MKKLLFCLKLIFCFCVFAQNDNIVSVIKAAWDLSEDGSQAQAEKSITQLKYSLEKNTLFPQFKFDAPNLINYQAGVNIGVFSSNVNASLEQKLPGAGVATITISKISNFDTLSKSFRQLPSVSLNVSLPLYFGINENAFDYDVCAAKLSLNLIEVKYRQVKNQLFLNILQNLMDFDSMQADVLYKDIIYKAAEAKLLELKLRELKGQTTKTELWKVENEVRVAKDDYRQNRFNLEKLSLKLKEDYGIDSASISAYSRSELLAFLQIPIRNIEIPEDEIFLIEKELTEINFQKKKQLESPVIFFGSSLQPNADLVPYSETWLDSWTSLTDTKAPWVVFFNLGIKYSSGFTGKETIESTIYEIEKNVRESKSKLEAIKRNQSYTFLIEEQKAIKEYFIDLNESLAKDKLAFVDMNALYERHELTEYERLTYMAIVKKAEAEKIKIEWSLIMINAKIRSFLGDVFDL